MPKKYQQKSLLTKPTSSAPSSLSLSRATSSRDNVQSERTVNDLLRDSRRGQGNESRLQNIITPSSIPPMLRAVLDMPAPPPPTPRQSVRGPSRLRRVPGPPPPRSWLIDSKHSSSSGKGGSQHDANARTRIYAQSSNLPGALFPPTTSLQHMLLKSMATRWQWHAEYDHEYLAELPVRMKELLLSYINIYCDGLEDSPTRLLFPHNVDAAECGEVKRLDLSNAICGWSSVRKIEKEFQTTNKVVVIPQNAQASRAPESWDDEDQPYEPLFRPVTPLSGPRFRNLKHLSLAALPSASKSFASWQDLLGLTSKLSTLTSLSLAHWPQPTYTPNASVGRYKVNALSGSSPTIVFGGTNIYSAFDDDWREAAGILRSLSRHLYCLQWLDLTGCGEWLPALIWKPRDEDAEFASPGPDWNGSWRSLEHLILAIGWSPGHPPRDFRFSAMPKNMTENAGGAIIHADTATDRTAEILSHINAIRLRDFQPSSPTDGTPAWDVEDEREKQYQRKETQQRMELEVRARTVAQALRSLRKEVGGRWLEIEFGPKEDTGEAPAV